MSAPLTHLRKRLPLLSSQVDKKSEVGLDLSDGRENRNALGICDGSVDVGVWHGGVGFVVGK